MADPTWPSVTLIVLTYNTAHTLPQCLTALLALDYPHRRIVVVDNASSDGTPALVAAQFPQVTLLQTPANRGFAAGNNHALRQLTTDVAVLVNPDVIVPPEWLKKLLTPMLADANMGVAGCKLTYPDGRLQHVGGVITQPQALPDMVGLRQADHGQHDAQRDVDYIIGAALAIRRQTMEAVGLMDEGFFLYFEEVDWCWRVRRAGQRVVVVPAATAVHMESASVQRQSPHYVQMMHRSRWRFLLKHLPINMILHQTLAAERHWLAAQPAMQRQATAVAYRQTLFDLPDILAARRRDGATAVSAADVAQIVSGLQSLHKQARGVGEWDDLAMSSVVVERPFASPTPLLGPLLARLRQGWSRVETVPYLRPILQQINDWNRALLAQLQQTQRAIVQGDANQLELGQQIAQQRQTVRQLHAALDAIEARLDEVKRD